MADKSRMDWVRGGAEIIGAGCFRWREIESDRKIDRGGREADHRDRERSVDDGRSVLEERQNG